MQELTSPPEGYDSVKGVGVTDSFFKVRTSERVLCCVCMCVSLCL